MAVPFVSVLEEVRTCDGEGGEGLRVVELARLDHAAHIGEGDLHHVEVFVRIEVLVRGDEAVREIEVDGLIAEAGRGVHRAELPEAPCAEARLFGELSGGADVRGFAGVDLPRGDLEERLFHGVAVLPHEEDRPVVRDGDDGARAGVEHHFPPGLPPADLHVVFVDVEELAFIDGRTLQ